MNRRIREIQKYSKYLGIVSFTVSFILLVTEFRLSETNIILQQNLYIYMMIFLFIGIFGNGIHYGVKSSSNDRAAIIVIIINILALPIFLYSLYLFISILG